MAHSSLLGIDPVPATPRGHDTESLGPSDSSDSGSDMAGIADLDDADPGLPVDVATAADRERPGTSFESLADGSDSDAGGTGERRSAGGDAGLREANDITPDRIVADPNTGEDGEGVLDDRLDESPRPRAGVAGLVFASAGEASDAGSTRDEDDDEQLVLAGDAGGDDDENGEVEPRQPGGGHPRSAARSPAGRSSAAARSAHAHDTPPPKRERDHGLSGPDPDVPAQVPPSDPGDEGVNDEGDDTVLLPR